MKKVALFFSLVFSFITYGEDLLLRGGNIHTADSEGILEIIDIFIIDGKINSIGKDLIFNSSLVNHIKLKIVSPCFLSPYSLLLIVDICLVP